jgi:hypothetical protein
VQLGELRRRHHGIVLTAGEHHLTGCDCEQAPHRRRADARTALIPRDQPLSRFKKVVRSPSSSVAERKSHEISFVVMTMVRRFRRLVTASQNAPRLLLREYETNGSAPTDAADA